MMPHVFLYAMLPTLAVVGMAWGLERDSLPRRTVAAVKDGLAGVGRLAAAGCREVAERLWLV